MRSIERNSKEIDNIFNKLTPPGVSLDFNPYYNALTLEETDDLNILTSKIDLICNDLLVRLIFLFGNEGIRNKYSSDVDFKTKVVYIVKKISDVISDYLTKVKDTIKNEQNNTSMFALGILASIVMGDQYKLLGYDVSEMFKYIYTLSSSMSAYKITLDNNEDGDIPKLNYRDLIKFKKNIFIVN